MATNVKIASVNLICSPPSRDRRQALSWNFMDVRTVEIRSAYTETSSPTTTVTQRSRARRAAALPAARSICDISQPRKMSPAGLVLEGIAIVRMTGSLFVPFSSDKILRGHACF